MAGAGVALALALSLALAAPAARAQAVPAAAAVDSFPVRVATFATTLLGSRAERTENVRLAASALDRLVVPPGGTLSFNATVGPRTLARGYREAPVILRDARELQAGGGVCQVASTVFVAALLSGLTVVERHRHSFPVDYIERGEDATIAWGAKDLRVANDSDQPLRLRVAVVGTTLVASFEAAEPLPETFELQCVERESDADADGTAPGREIDLYRVRHRDGEPDEREFVHRDDYPPMRARDR